MASALVLRGAHQSIRWLCCREIQNSLAASVYKLLVDRIDYYGLSTFYNATQRGIFGRNGTEFLFAGLRTNPDSIKSMEGLDGAWVEEADRCSQTSLDLLTPTIRKPKSEIWFSWNRRHKTDPVDNLFLGGEPPPNTLIQPMSWRDNPFFPDVLREEMEWLKHRDRDKWLHVWEGHPMQRSESRVFRNWEEGDLDDRVGSASPLFGADWGLRNPTVLVKCYVLDKNILYIADEVYKIGATIEETPALFAGSTKLSGWDGRRENHWGHPGMPGLTHGTIIADAASPQIVNYLRDRGFTIRLAIKGMNSVKEGVSFMQSMDIIVHPRCKHCIDELETYSYKVDPHTDVVLSELEDKDNHVIDALRYALETTRRKLTGAETASRAVLVEMDDYALA